LQSLKPLTEGLLALAQTRIVVLPGPRHLAGLGAGALSAVFLVTFATNPIFATLTKEIVQGWFTREAQLAAFLTLPVPFSLTVFIGFVAEILLFLSHMAEFVERAAHFLCSGIGLARPGDAKIFKDVLQLLQHFPCAGAVP
jgi:hypothetical protein